MRNFTKKSWRYLLFFLCCGISIFILCCGENIKELDALMNKYDKTIGETIIIDVVEKDLLEIKCNNDSCEVNKNVITAIKEGQCNIKIKYKDEEKEITVNVKSKINISKYRYDMFIGDEFELEKIENISYIFSGEGLEIEGNKVLCKAQGNYVVKAILEGESKDIEISVKDIIINDNNINGFVGDILTIGIENPDGKDINFSTIDNIISVDGNKIKCLEKGVTTVFVEYDGAVAEVNVNVYDKIELLIDKQEYKVNVNEEVIINPYVLVNGVKDDTALIECLYNGDIIEINEYKIKGIKPGGAIITIKSSSLEIMIKIIVEESVNFEVNDIELFVGESKDIDINIIKGDSKDLIVTPLEDNVEYVNGKLIGKKVGETIVKVKLLNLEKEFKVIVNRLQIKVLNEKLELDFLEKLELEIEYPEFLEDELSYKVGKPSVLKVEDGKVIPLSEGKSQIIISLKNNPDIKKVITVTVTVDPIKIIELLHMEEVLMKKEVSTYGSVVRYQSVMGSVSRYLFDELVIEENIINVTENPYVGQKATPEILEELDETQKPRTGVLLEEIKYITYHDTGNNNGGADAKMHANYMVSSASIQYRARSWHYTVDSGTIIHHIPDNEVAWQGDTYDAYSKSIGIETCVNFGANLHLVWQKMGKLCAMLIAKYGLEISSIKQHYDWNQKNCPQTLRRNNLYSYAISLVEGELLARQALKGYEIKFESLNPEYLNEKGYIIKAPNAPIKVGYVVTITNSKGYNQSITLYSTLNPLS